jgi:alkyldihydroxyacetonephosphate synthase
MNRIINVDTESLIVTAQAGIDGLDVEKPLNAKGLTLAHYPGSLYWGATLGGWIAARGAGVTSTKYGKAEDLLVQLEAVVPPGRTISTLPVPSHAVGPGLLGLLAGSEGTLGVITTASMRLDPLPENRIFLSFRFDSIFEGLEAGRDIMTSRWRPAVIRLYDEAGARSMHRVLDTGTDGVTMIIVCDGDPRLTEVEADAIAELCTKHKGVDLGPSPARKWWEGQYEPHTDRHAPAPPTIFGTTDACCTFDKIANLYRAKKATIEEGFSRYGARYTAHFSHWYPWGTMVYDRFYVDEPPDDPKEALKLHDQMWDAAVRTSLRCGAVMNDHHGVGVKLGRFMREQYGETFPLLQAIKAAWDPDGIMNPGKLGFGPPSRDP